MSDIMEKKELLLQIREIEDAIEVDRKNVETLRLECNGKPAEFNWIAFFCLGIFYLFFYICTKGSKNKKYSKYISAKKLLEEKEAQVRTLKREYTLNKEIEAIEK